MTTPLVMVAMGIDAESRRTELDELAAEAGASVAFLQGADPALTTELSRLYDGGARHIRVIRVPVGVNPPARSWLTRVVGSWLTQHDDVTVEVRGREIRRNDSLTSPDWETVPGHRHQVLVCRGPRCAARGAADTTAAIDAVLAARGLGDDDILVTQTGCLFPCNHAPVVVAQPDDWWFGPVRADSVPALIDHLRHGTEFGPLLHRERQTPA